MNYIVKRQKTYYYYRRTPSSLKAYDPRPFIRISLRTDSPALAAKLAHARNQEIENYWQQLIKTGSFHSLDKFNVAVKTARLFGFGYYPAAELANMPLSEIFVRLDRIEKSIKAPRQVEALAGGVAKPLILLSDCFSKYLACSKNLVMNKTGAQIRKWQNPRKKAMRNFIAVVGDKPLHELTRSDTIKVKDALIERVQHGKIIPVSANKEIVFAKTIIETVSDNFHLNLDIKHLFRKLILDKGEEGKRPPFETNYIINTLLNEKNLSGLNAEAKAALFALAETGAGFSELTGFRKEDIIIDHDIPHIIITSREKHTLKTKYRRRVIPLVGFALEAFTAFPNGFTSYFEKPDNLSATVNKYLNEHKLLPTKKHTAYSLRHSFQDRLLSVNAPDRLQADLMGHKLGRPSYGDGSSLQQKLEWLKKITLKCIL
ncbi:DUF6538 domain-containing protein [Ferruginibacter sp. HRS2-29]|uniref:DUF6538 domain-containing protein n=1 Tax=Ferruginibacter sp. HRS2-29 TaxID=2487334 RepID=UPI0020CDCCCD|nr:DUF6538 domain-containing protein [Ferruginibacter sp. HRS2-29]MCP9749986.1 hypothetical protein [Ferruginibacter sp. HRS2-29]